MLRPTIEMRALARLAVVLLAAVGIMLMHGISADHHLMSVSMPSPHSMVGEISASTTHATPIAGTGDEPMTMDHAACVAVLRAPDVTPHLPVAPTAVLAGAAAEVCPPAVALGGSRLPSRASPPDLATELCICRT